RLVWSRHVQFWHVAVLAALYGCATTLDMPARQSYMAHLVPRADLMNAIALNSAVFNGARVVGPAAAGLLVARYGTAAAFLLNGASFIAVIGALAAVRTGAAPAGPGGGFLRTGPGFSAVIGALAAIRTEGAPRPRSGLGMGAEIAEG